MTMVQENINPVSYSRSIYRLYTTSFGILVLSWLFKCTTFKSPLSSKPL